MPQKTANQAIDRYVTELWWIGVIQAILAILFGVVTIFWPHLTLVVLVYLLSAFVILIGITEVMHSFMTMRSRDTWWLRLILGLVALGVGLYLVRHPNVTFATFILIVGITFIARGIIDIMIGFLDRSSTSRNILNFIVGLAAIAAGIIILVQPVAGGLAFVWVLGLYAFVLGTIALAEAVEQHRDYEELKAALRT